MSDLMDKATVYLTSLQVCRLRMLDLTARQQALKDIPAAEPLVQGMQEELNALTMRIAEATRLIDRINNERYRFILISRYLCGRTIQSISAEMKLDPKYIFRLRKAAMLQLMKIIQQENNAATDAVTP